jgi:DNA-binding winged helix-turn-helix (wHTH) protein
MSAAFSWKRTQVAGQEIERPHGSHAPVNQPAAPSAGNRGSQPLTGGATRLKPNIAARCVSFGDFEMDLQEQRLMRGSQSVKIQGKVYQALLVLIETPGELVTREQLRNRLWPRDAHLNYDANVNTTVNKLRQILGDTSESAIFIQTIPRRGYAFIAKVGYADVPSMVEIGGGAKPARGESRFRGSALLPGFLRSERARIWFTASVVTWIAAAVFFASAIIIYAHRAAHAADAPAKSTQEIGGNAPAVEP